MLELDPPDVLLTVAEVAVAFAGFASLSAIIANQFAGERLEVATGRLRILLGSSLTTIAVAFIPIVLIAFGISEDRVWQLSSILVLVILASSSVGTIRRVQVMSRLPDFNRVAGVFMLMLTLLNFGALMLAASGIASFFEVYLLAICAQLTTCGIMFALLVLTILTARERESEG